MKSLRQLWICTIILLCHVHGFAQTDPLPPFVPDGVYDESVPTPESILGFPVGEKPATYEQIIQYFKTISDALPNVTLHVYGHTHEGRDQVYAVVSSPENMARLDEIKRNNDKLADPRLLAEGESAEAIIETNPAIAWMGYSIHGDEVSGSDASLWVLYQLAAGQDETTKRLRENVVACIDPMQNPDGRMRFLDVNRKFQGSVPNSDLQSVQHTGLWPGGRGNHYFFDLNRDLFFLTQPESRGRIPTFLEWNPQLQIDSHEMGSLSTFLFSPAREPINRYQNPKLEEWRRRFAEDQAKAFDRYGWSYYTREWVDNWFPGYTDWITYNGAVHVLHEQASTDGSVVMQTYGKERIYRESVHHQIVSSLTNLESLSKYRQDKLRDFFAEKTDAVKETEPNEVFAYIFPPSKNRGRLFDCIGKLAYQQIEIRQAVAPFAVTNLTDTWGKTYESKTFPSDTYIIHTRQPLKRLIQAIMDFDPQFTDTYLNEERFYLEKFGTTRLYDYSTWSVPIAFGLECYYTNNRFSVRDEAASIQLELPPPPSGQPLYGYILNGDDDRSRRAVVELLKHDATVRVSNRPFQSGGHEFPIGSFLLRLDENNGDIHSLIPTIREKTKAIFYNADTALDLDAVDLGGGHFQLLQEPRIALLMGEAISSYSYGETWHWLDCQLEYRMSSLNAYQIHALDLRPYNVLVIPSSGSLKRAFTESGIDRIKQWVRNGGTLIALGSSVGLLTDPEQKWSKVRQRNDALKELETYFRIGKREAAALTASASREQIYKWSPDTVASASKEESFPDALVKIDKERDSWEARFSPHGAFLKATAEPYNWLAYGVGNPIAVMTDSSSSYYAKPPVQTAVRFTGMNDLRVSGLLWPEVRKRYAYASYCTRERFGYGQLILFPYNPQGRAYFPETKRLLWNAVFLGPGLGSNQPQPW